jgi:hypothetical protein
MVGSLIDQLISLIQAPWMNKVYSLLLKINKILDLLHSLFDWRNVQLCKYVVLGLTLSVLLHLFVLSFNGLILLLIWLLYLILTPFFKKVKKYLLLPIFIPKRLKYLNRVRKEKENRESDESDKSKEVNELLKRVVLSESELNRILKDLKVKRG